MKTLATFFLVAYLATTINGMSLFLEHKMLPDWDNLKVTWGINPFSPDNFVGMPLTEADAKAQGWTKEKGCGEVNGNRYMFMGDTAVMLIYNTHGNISGLATAVPKGIHSFVQFNIIPSSVLIKSDFLRSPIQLPVKEYPKTVQRRGKSMDY